MTTLYQQIMQHTELSRLLPLIPDITVIEYNGANIQGSKGLYDYLSGNAIPTGIVSRIILCGKSTDISQDNVARLRALFPSVEPEFTLKNWRDTDFKAMKVCAALVFHMIGECVTIEEYDTRSGIGERVHEIIEDTRQAYYACSLSRWDLFWNEDCLRAQLRLSDFELEEREKPTPPTDFCKEKQEYIKMFQNTLRPMDLFFQCIEEAEHGCEDCNQCRSYGKRKQCPFAQRKIAEFYREGIYVSADATIAHQWEIMASRQGYKPAHIQVADDLLEGRGCDQSTSAALEIYREYAKSNDECCINRIIEIAEDSYGKERMTAIPYIAALAKGGNEDMILKLSNALQNGDYGLPRDIVQQEEWIRQGAENGNPRFVKAMAEMYEADRNWAVAYKWYKMLAEISPNMVPESKMEEIELKMLFTGATDEEIAQKGMNYLFGYYGTERNPHLAFRCLNYAKDKNIVGAKPLLGQMYFYGIGVDSNIKVGTRLIVEASNQNDILGVEKFIYILYADTIEIPQIRESLMKTIDAGVQKGNTWACYLKGKCMTDSRLYDKSEFGAFALMSLAANRDYPPAQYSLALMYKEGIGTGRDSKEYARWLEKSAKNGHFEAEGLYGVRLFNGIFERDKAFKYLTDAVEQGFKDIEVRWALSQCYMNGYGTEKDQALAFKMYKELAEEGKMAAQEELCDAYYWGKDCLEKNYAESARWGEAAIAQGSKAVRFKTAYSSAKIGNKERARELYLELSREGNGLAMNNYACQLSDPKETVEWFQKAVDAGDDYGMWNLARYYKNGIVVEKDINKALALYKRSSSKGCVGATIDLARMYRYGDDVQVDGAEAVKWLERAIAQGDDDSLLMIADIYLDGEILEQNVDRALSYLRRASEKGIVKALIKLGEIYEKGIGSEKIIHKAVFWYRKAAAKGNIEAKERLERLHANWVVDGKIEDAVDEENISTN